MKQVTRQFEILNRILLDIGARATSLDASHPEKEERLAALLDSELCVSLKPTIMFEGLISGELVGAISQLLPRSRDGMTIVDLFGIAERSARQHLHSNVTLRWFSTWQDYANVGNWLTCPDWQDFFEMFMEIEESLSMAPYLTSSIDLGESVGKTVKRLWKESLH